MIFEEEEGWENLEGMGKFMCMKSRVFMFKDRKVENHLWDWELW